MTTGYIDYPTPFGELLLTVNSEGVLDGLNLPNHRPVPGADWKKAPAALKEACAQLKAYFAGRLQRFDLPLAPAGTSFQAKVWSGLQTIPYGETISYVELAEQIGHPRSYRAVGNANGANPIAIIIPCHRVIAAGGGLGGYGGGLATKQFLLDLEARAA